MIPCADGLFRYSAYRALGGAFKFVVRENQTCARGVKGWFEGRVAIGDTPNAGWRLVLGPNVRDAS